MFNINNTNFLLRSGIPQLLLKVNVLGNWESQIKAKLLFGEIKKVKQAKVLFILSDSVGGKEHHSTSFMLNQYFHCGLKVSRAILKVEESPT